MRIFPCFFTVALTAITLFAEVRDVAAQTDLYVRGAGKLIPIGIPVLCSQGGNKESSDLVPTTLRKDLDLSGYFEVLNPSGYIETPGKCGAQEATTYSDWTVIGTEGLIKGQISSTGNGVQVQMYLHDVQKQTVVLAKQYEGDPSQVKKMAHRFANEVMKYYTGFPGVFGTQISFSSRVGRFKELFVMEMDGSNLRQLTNDRGLALSSAWDPSGNRLVYTSFRNRVPDLFLMDITSRKVRQITRTTDLEVGAHFLNSEEIVFSRTEGSDSDIMAMNLDGSNLRRITPPNRAIDVSPVPSPDGSQIVFCSDRGGGPQIYVMGVDGSDPRRVSFGQSKHCTSPTWAPKGDKIAFVCMVDGGINIFITDPSGSNTTQLTSVGKNEDPEFSPDGRYLTFATTQFGGGYSIALMRIDGLGLKQITASRGGDFEPAWGPLLD